MTTTTKKPDPDQAGLAKAARVLLRMSCELSNGGCLGELDILPGHHYIHAATALAVLRTGDVSNWVNYTALVRAVDEEGGNA